MFYIKKLPPTFQDNFLGTTSIINLNIRGRRGNIVEVYPSVEYDFVPNVVNAKRNDYLHIQWTGSDANQNGNSGNGRDGTDRNNLVIASSQGVHYPSNMAPLTGPAPTAFTNDYSILAKLAYLNQNASYCDPNTADANSVTNCKKLNSASGYQNFGLVKMENIGTWNIMSTRNNAFSNREQKGTINVVEDTAVIVVATTISVASLAVLGAGIFAVKKYGDKHPGSKAALLTTAVTAPFVSRRSRQSSDAPLEEPVKHHFIIAKIIKWWTWEGQRVTILLIYFLVNVIVWIYGYASNLAPNNPPYFPFAKGFGKMLDINCAFIILPVLRNTLCWLRSTPLADIVPLDDNIVMHKITFGVISISAIFHAVFHYLDFYWAAAHLGTTVVSQAWGTVVGATGHLVGILMLVMCLTAIVNRKLFTIFGKRFDGYKIFLAVHKLWIPVMALLWIHGPIFWAFSLWPLCLMALEKAVQQKRAKVDVTILDAKIVGKDVLALKMRLQGKRKFTYKAGEYLFLNCPDIAEAEWHPFTITSAPEESFFSCHIRCRPDMDWCYKLRTALGLANPSPNTTGTTKESSKNNLSTNRQEIQKTVPQSNEPSSTNSPNNPNIYSALPAGSESVSHLVLPRLRVDGPYGAPSEEVFDHSTVILVGAGIGVTPFISILKSMSIRYQKRKVRSSLDNINGTSNEEPALKIYFYWICRDVAEFESFKDLLDAVIDSAELKQSLQVNTYTTGELDLKNVKYERYNQFSGKPNWARILKEKTKDHQGEEIGVFMCGPLPLAKELSVSCKRQNQREESLYPTKEQEQLRTAFKFHKENF